MKQRTLHLRRHEGRNTLTRSALVMFLTLCCPAALRAQQWTTNSTDTTKIGTSAGVGSVGVGTMSPAYELHVEGQSTNANNYVQGYFKNTSSALPYGGVGVDGQSQSHVRFFLGGVPKWQWRAGAGTNIDDLRAFSWTLGRDVLTMTYGGNVGVGTTAPANALHVNNDFGPGMMRVSGAGVGLVNLADNNAAADRKLYQLRSESGLFRLGLVNDAALAFVQRDILVANASGNIGFGTASPASPASFARAVHLRDPSSASYVVDAGGAYRYEFGVSSGGGWLGTNDAIPLRVATGGAERMRIDASGNVGVGTQSPSYKLHVSQGSVGIQNGGGDAVLVTTSGAAGESLTTGWSTSGYGYLQGGVWGAAARDVVLQGGGGGVGVGMRPSRPYRLDVAGSIRASADLEVAGAITGGTINAAYQDVAEWVPSTQKLRAGTVVVLDAERANHVLASTAPYDTKVAGVVSERPGITLGEGGEGKALVATTGRVKVWADATRGPIHVGDLLVTSDTEGLAMRSEPVEVGGRKMHAPGTIIGKALEALERGTGEILVLLTLQ